MAPIKFLVLNKFHEMKESVQNGVFFAFLSF